MGEVVQRHLRPPGDPRPGRQPRRLLPRARHRARPLASAAGPVRRLHRQPERERLPVAAHHRHGPGARPLEVQIRTYEMHRTAEYGVAAHWRYKEGGRATRFEERINWLRQLLDWQRETAEAEEFVEYVKTDMFRDQVFVFSPKARSKSCPPAPRLSTSPSAFTPISASTASAPR